MTTICGFWLKVAWTSYESVGNGNWEDLEKKAYEIPLTPNASEQARRLTRVSALNAGTAAEVLAQTE